MAYRDVANDDPRYAPATGNTITRVVEPRSVFRGPDTLSTVDDYYKDADIVFDGVPDAFGVAYFFGLTREITIKSVYRPNFNLTTSRSFTLRPPIGRTRTRVKSRGRAPT